MNIIHKPLLFTFLNLLLCLSVFAALFESNTPTVQAQAAPFLGPIYFGSTAITAIFDHDTPDFDVNLNDRVHHYDNQVFFDPNIPINFGYDGHNGIDYGLSYRPVLAGAEGDVADAGWYQPQNHQSGLGLRVTIDHANGYQTEYGHLSALVVQTGDEITLNNNFRWVGVIGTSGNTGDVDGWGCDPATNLLCGAHLHFTLRDPNGFAINPYGWNPPVPELPNLPAPDPWSLENGGQAVSFNAWSRRPSVTTNQFGAGGNELPQPPLNDAMQIIIDDSSQDFTHGCSWQSRSATDGYLESIHYAPVVTSNSNCTAKWSVSVPFGGAYYVFTHIPSIVPGDPMPPLDVSDHALYTISGNDDISEAIILQSAYADVSVNNNWAYLGKHDFALSGEQYIELNRHGHNSEQDMIADAIKLIPAPGPTGCPIGQPQQLSTSFTWSVAGDGDGRIKLIWNDGNIDLSFNVYRNTTNSTDDWMLVYDDEDGTSGEWVDTTVINGTTYYYWLELYECDEFLELLGPQTAVSTPPRPTPTPISGLPSPPTGLTATYNGDVPTTEQSSSAIEEKAIPEESITLGWTSGISIEQAKSSMSYNVYRSDSALIPLDAAHRIGSNVTGTSYVDVGGRLYHYYVITAVNENGESGTSNIATAGCSDC